MPAKNDRDHSHLAIDIEPGLRRRIEGAAADQGVSLRDYVVAVLSKSLDDAGENRQEIDAAWSRLSVPAFARDWESDADAVYDDLA